MPITIPASMLHTGLFWLCISCFMLNCLGISRLCLLMTGNFLPFSTCDEWFLSKKASQVISGSSLQFCYQNQICTLLSGSYLTNSNWTYSQQLNYFFFIWNFGTKSYCHIYIIHSDTRFAQHSILRSGNPHTQSTHGTIHSYWVTVPLNKTMSTCIWLSTCTASNLTENILKVHCYSGRVQQCRGLNDSNMKAWQMKKNEGWFCIICHNIYIFMIHNFYIFNQWKYFHSWKCL